MNSYNSLVKNIGLSYKTGVLFPRKIAFVIGKPYVFEGSCRDSL